MIVTDIESLVRSITTTDVSGTNGMLCYGFFVWIGSSTFEIMVTREEVENASEMFLGMSAMCHNKVERGRG